MAPLPSHRPPILDFVTKSPVLFWLLIATLVIFSTLGFGYIVYVSGGAIKRNLALYDPAVPLHAQLKNEPVPRYLFYARYLNFGRPVSKGSLLFGLQRRFEERYLWKQNERRHEALARIRSILRSGSPLVMPPSRWQLFKETLAKLSSRKAGVALPPSGSATPTQTNWVAQYLRENKDTADYAIPLPSTSPVLKSSQSEKKQPTGDAQRCSWWTSDSESVYSQGSYEEDEVISDPGVSVPSIRLEECPEEPRTYLPSPPQPGRLWVPERKYRMSTRRSLPIIPTQPKPLAVLVNLNLGSPASEPGVRRISLPRKSHLRSQHVQLDKENCIPPPARI